MLTRHILKPRENDLYELVRQRDRAERDLQHARMVVDGGGSNE